MSDLNPTNRDRYLAAAAELMLWWQAQDDEEKGLLGVAEALDEANRAGREEGIGAVVRWLNRQSELPKAEPSYRSACAYLAGDLEHFLEVGDPMKWLLDQPPKGEETP